ncbi:MAG: hypothetical protein ABIC19_02895 [Patescibacteria group bacterium]
MPSSSSLKKNIIAAGSLIVLGLALLLVIKIINRVPKQEQIQEKPANEDLFLPEDPSISQGYPWGHDLSKISPDSIGQPAYLGDYIHMSLYARPGTRQIVTIEADQLEIQGIEAGQKTPLKVKVYNPEKYPLINLQLYGVLYKQNEKKNLRADIKDSFLINPGFNLLPGEIKELDYDLDIPRGLLTGDYTITLGLNQDHTVFYTLNPYQGFINQNWTASESTIVFNVRGQESGETKIIKNTLRLSNLGHDFLFRFKEITLYDPDTRIKFSLANNSDQARQVEIKYNPISLAGDQLTEFDPEWEKLIPRETVTVEANKTKEIDFPLNFDQYGEKVRELERSRGIHWADNTRSFTTLKIETKDNLGDTNVVYIPIFIDYYNYISCHLFPQITAFPVRKGQKFDLVVGFLNYKQAAELGDPSYSQEEHKGKIQVKLYDKENNEIGGLMYDGVIDAKRKGWKNTIKADKNLNYIKLVGKIYYENGALSKVFEREYDCEALGPDICLKQSSIYQLIFFVVIIALFGLTAVFFVRSLVKNKKANAG